MHPLFEKADRSSKMVIGAAIEVHRHMGPSLIESIYERCLVHELDLRSLPSVAQKIVRVEYKGFVFDEPLRFDLVVSDCLLVESKSRGNAKPDKQSSITQLYEAPEYSSWLAN